MQTGKKNEPIEGKDAPSVPNPILMRFSLPDNCPTLSSRKPKRGSSLNKYNFSLEG